MRPLCLVAATVAGAACVAKLLLEHVRLLGVVGHLQGDLLRNLDHTVRLLQPTRCQRSPAAPAAFEVAVEAGPPACGTRPAPNHTVAAVLSGRRDRMRLLLPYLDALRRSSHLDEVHLWDYSRAAEDEAWLRRAASQRGYRLFKVRDADNRHLAVYEHYASEPAARPTSPRFRPPCSGPTPDSTVIVKIDDDVVFVNTSAFARFVAFVRARPELQLVHANVINNGVAAYYQARRFPWLRAALPELTRYPEHAWRAGLGGALVYDARLGLRLHQLFASDPAAFSWEGPEADACLAFEPPPGVGATGLGQGQFSVNFFAARWAAWRGLRDLVHCVDIDYDEPAVTALATRLGHRQCLFAPLSVAHLSFGTQDAGVLLPGALPLYEVPCLLLPFRHARFLIIYFHANAEDLGLCYSFCKIMRDLFQVHVLAVEYEVAGVILVSSFTSIRDLFRSQVVS